MTQNFNLEQYLSNGIENIIKSVIKSAFTNPRESLFFTKYAIAAEKSKKLRRKAADQGAHIPPFLIASITSKCNLQCAGCYARANQSCCDTENDTQLSKSEWGRIFKEAFDLGIAFILLAGGEPLMRPDVIEEAAKNPDIIFPVFTNGTMFSDSVFSMFDKHRNIVPIISIEGDEHITDARRGIGIYSQLMATMQELNKRKILFGASVTVTNNNMENVTSDAFLDVLHKKDCKVILYVEYVPVDLETKQLAFTDEDRTAFSNRIQEIRKVHENMIFISFPGDEKASGGCLAAGRGFFHINVSGGAEPCPFSPVSDISLRENSLKEAINSPLFIKLRSGDILKQYHNGGCVLFEQEEKVKQLLETNV